MSQNWDSTCWSLIHRAGEADDAARELFVERYYPVVRAYLSARFTRAHRAPEVEDAAQDVFAECLRVGGALAKTSDLRRKKFRSFLYGVVRNVARRHEEHWARNSRAATEEVTTTLPAQEEPLEEAFDRSWAKAVVAEAIDLQRERAMGQGDRAHRRVEMLRLRFYEGCPVREIAQRWDAPADQLHRELTRSKLEFADCLQEVLRMHLGGDDMEGAQRRLEDLADLLD